jgi:hypothetical protein
MKRTHALCWIVAIAGCAEEPLPEDEPAAASVQQPLNGTVIFPDSSCSAAEQQLIRDGLAFAASQVVDNPQVIIDCLAEATLTGTRNAWAEQIVAEVRQDMPTRASCTTGPFNATAPVGISNEQVTYAHGFLQRPDANPAGVASVTLHEIAHNKGYSHHDTLADFPALFTAEYGHTVPVHIEACSWAQSQGMPISWATARTSVPDRAELGPVGREGGFPGEIGCGPGAFVHGLNLRAGGAIDQVGFSCRTPSGVATPNSPAAGGGGGFLAVQSCAAGELAVGLVGSAAVTLHSLGLVCNRTERVIGGDPSTQVIRQKIGDPSAGQSFTRICPAGMALQSSFVRSGALVDRMRPMCQRVDYPTPTVHTDRILPRIGGLAGPNQPWEEILECPGRSAVAEIDGTFGSEVFHLSSKCRGLDPIMTTTGTYQRATTEFEPKVQGAGGWTGTAAIQRCPEGEVAIGVRGRADDRLRRIGLVCADAEHWSRADVTPAVWLVNPLGTSNTGSAFDSRCQRGEFLAGWKVRTGKWDVERVSFIEPVCRRFPNPHFCSGSCTNPLTVTVNGPGTVTGSPALTCYEASTCTAQMGTATTVTLSALPDPSESGATFDGWTNCPSPSGTTCTVTMEVARAITASFSAPACTFNACKAQCMAECQADGMAPFQCSPICNDYCAVCEP